MEPKRPCRVARQGAGARHGFAARSESGLGAGASVHSPTVFETCKIFCFHSEEYSEHRVVRAGAGRGAWPETDAPASAAEIDIVSAAKIESGP